MKITPDREAMFDTADAASQRKEKRMWFEYADNRIG
jgi:hypothetical protein